MPIAEPVRLFGVQKVQTVVNHPCSFRLWRRGYEFRYVPILALEAQLPIGI